MAPSRLSQLPLKWLVNACRSLASVPMPNQSSPPKTQRIVVLLAVVALHATLLIAFLVGGTSAAPPAAKAGVLSLISIAAELPAQRPPPPPKLPSKVIDEIKRLTVQALEFEPDSSALAVASGQCATLDVVSKAIVGDPTVVAAVVQAPLETRSIAEAIVLWNAGWSDAASTPGSPLSPARTIVEQSLILVDDGCLDEQIAGPRLVPVPVPGSQSTMFLVFGSGTWTWRQLLEVPLRSEQMTPDEPRSKPWYEFDWR